MSSIGPLSPGTMADDSAVGSVSWSSPDNAKVSDNVYATMLASGTGTPHYLKATNFGFSIPTGATITGLLVEVKGKISSISDRWSLYSFAVKGGVINTPYFFNGSLTDTDEYVPQSFNNLWGQTWTPADINDSGFGIAITTYPNHTITFSVDHIRITVTYTETPSVVSPFPSFFRTP